MKTIKEVCNEMLFEKIDVAQEILTRNFPGHSVLLGEDNSAIITDIKGNTVATITKTGINYGNI